MLPNPSRERPIQGPLDPDVLSPKNISLFLLAVLFVPGVVAFLLATFQEAQVAALMLGLVALATTIAFPFVGLLFFVGLLYTRPEDLIEPLQGMRFSLMASLVSLIGLLVQRMMSKEKAAISPANGLLIAFGAICVLSTVPGGGDPFTAATDIGKLVILFFLVINLVRKPQQYQTFISALLCFTVYLACYAAYLFFSGAALKHGDDMRAQGSGIFGDPNDLAASIVAGLALAMTRSVQAKGFRRFGYIGLSLFLIWACLLTNSRGGMLALMGILGAFVFIYIPGKSAAILLAVALGVGMLKFGPSRMSQMDTQEESANSRFWFWYNGVEMLKSRPLTGVGYNEFPANNGSMTAHNSYVLCFGELGLPGYFCWIGCFYYCFRVRYPQGNGSKSKARSPRGSPRPREWIRQNLPHERIGARLGLAGFMMAAFWISRTYVPVFFLLMSVPLVQVLAFQQSGERILPTPQERFRDFCYIALISVGSILVIYAIAYKLR